MEENVIEGGLRGLVLRGIRTEGRPKGRGTEKRGPGRGQE